MKKAVVYTSQRRRTNRARSIQALLHHHARPHGGNAAERVKQARPHGMTSRLANEALYTDEAATTETSS